MYKCRFSEKLIELRNAAGITQAELANKISVSDKVISKWENGLSTPDIETLILIAEYFGVSADVMLGREVDGAEDIVTRLCEEFKELDRNQAIYTAFDISKTLVPAMFESMDRDTPVGDGELFYENRRHDQSAICYEPFRNCISNKDFYNLAVGSEEVNLAVMLWRSDNNFQWLNDSEKKRQIAAMSFS